MMHKSGSIGNAVRDLAPGATFRVNGDGLTIADFEWMDDDIERPSDDDIETKANFYDKNGVQIP